MLGVDLREQVKRTKYFTAYWVTVTHSMMGCCYFNSLNVCDAPSYKLQHARLIKYSQSIPLF